MNTLFANKSSASTIIALAITLVGVLFQAQLIKTIGFFALSGAVTNWLAVYMLFEKVPFLYGSGVIPERFEEFKASIKQLMMEQFFTINNIEQFIETEEQQGSSLLNITPLLEAVDYDKFYQGLVSSIMESSFGGMLLMMGGVEALAPLKEPFIEKMRSSLIDMVNADTFKSALQQGLNAHKISEDIVSKIEIVIDKRLSELTPQLVKEMVQAIIREHLGWLVVWGGVFGGVMGLIFEGFA
ncbi:MAG: DUF445 domain-containing protein [Methylococcaceae bacterium]